MELHIAIVPEILGEFLGTPITNTLLTSWLVMAGLILFAVVFSRFLKEKPGKMQNFVELLFGSIADFMEEVFGDRKRALLFFPLILTIFLFIWVSKIL